MSKDAITYSTLAAQTNFSGFNEVISPVGTDEDEYKRWLATQGELEPEGQVIDDFTDDLTDAGFIPDESGHRYA